MTLLQSLRYETEMPRIYTGRVVITTAPEGYHAIPEFAHRRQVVYLWFERYRCVECKPMRATKAERAEIIRFAESIGLLHGELNA